MSRARSLGDAGEARAAAYLLEHGFTLITRRYKTRHGELDLVALDGDELVFVEVKTRSTGRAEEALGPTKAARWRSAAREYLQKMNEEERAHRFDFIAIDADGLRHHRGVLD